MLSFSTFRRFMTYKHKYPNTRITHRFSSSIAYPDVIHKIQTINSSQDLYKYVTSLSTAWINNNLSITTIALSTASKKFNDIDIGMKIYHYLIENSITRTENFYHSLFNLLNCNETEYENDDSLLLNMDVIHAIIKQMTCDSIDLSASHTDCVLKWVQCQKNPSIANLTNLYELFVDKLCIRPSHLTFEYQIIGCCKAESVNDAMKYFEIAINEFYDIPSVHTVRSLVECIDKYSLQNNKNAVEKLEIVMNEMSVIYKKNDVFQYNELMNDRLIAFCAMDIYFNYEQYEKCVNIYDSIKNIENYSQFIGNEFLSAIYYKSCVQMMHGESESVKKREYVEAIMNMNVNGMNEEMKMIKFEGMCWIYLHKPFGFVILKDALNEICDDLFEETQHFIYVDEVNKQKNVNLDHLSSNEMKICVIVYLLQKENENYGYKIKMNENALFKTTLTSECSGWSMNVDQKNEFITLTSKT